MVKAMWNGELLAESTETVVVEGNHYFPKQDVKMNMLRDSSAASSCPWKGTARYYDVVIGDETNAEAAWYYPDPKPAASEIRDKVAFWKGVEVR